MIAALRQEPEQPAPARQAAVGPGSLLRAISWMGAGHLVSQASVFASVIVLAALVPPASFGVVAAGVVMVNVAILLMDAGTRGRIITSGPLTRAEVYRSTLGNVAVGVVVAAAVAGLAGPIVAAFATGGDADVIRALFLSIVAYGFAIVPLAVLQKELRFKEHARVTAGAAFLASLVAVVAGVLGAGVWALVLRQVLSSMLLAVFAWGVAGRLVAELARDAASRARGIGLRRVLAGPAFWFFLLAATDFAALNLDNLIIGRLGGAEALGLYALAFLIAFAPLVQFSWPIGKVLFPAAAAEADPRVVRDRTARSVRLVSLVLLPLLPPTLALAPAVLPGVLGEEWKGMVLPFQLLLLAGVGHAIVNCIGESLSGTGHVAFRAKINLVWMPSLLVAVAVLAELEGLPGAAAAHLALFVPLAAVYTVAGARRLGLDVRRLGTALAPVALPVAMQGALTAALALGLRSAGLGGGTAAAAGVVAGVGALAIVFLARPDSPLREARALLAAARAERLP